MRITLLLVGKTVKGWISEGLNVYKERLGHYVNFEIKELKDLKDVKEKALVKEKEGEMILKSLKSEDRVILLDEKGEELTSPGFAKRIEADIRTGRNVVYIIGGPYGFSDAVYERADAKLSLSRMTFSHQMVRVIFTEQLYRAFTIINGEPYHHE